MAEENQDKNEALEKGKQAIKNKIMQKAKPWIIKGVAVLLGIILVGALVLGIFDAIGDAIQSVTEAITDFFTLDEDGAIVISEEQIDEVINSITDLGVDLEDLYLMGDVDYDDSDIEAANKRALRLYIKKFYEAQAMTQTINTNPSWLEELGGKTYGTIYVYRTNGEDVIDKDTKVTQLTYMKYDELKAKKESGSANAEELSKYFSLDEEGKLVVVGYSTTTITQNNTVNSTTDISLKTIDYKNVVSQYTTSMNFLLYLAMISQNPNFASAVTDLVKNSEIRITLLDTTHETIDTQTERYTINTHNIANRATTTKDVMSVKQVVTKSRSPVPKITYVKTWFLEQSITYNKKPSRNPGTTLVYDASNDSSLADQTPPTTTTNGVKTWITNRSRTVTTTTKSSKYEEGTKGDVIDRTGEKGSPGIKDKNNNGIVDGSESVDDETTFIGLLDNKFKIPNSTRYDWAGSNLASGAEWLFSLLQKDASSQNLEQLMRYILYKYTGRDYGVTEFDFSIYNIKDFKTVGGGNSLIEEILKSYENGPLRAYINGESANYSAVKEYITADRKQYKVHYTSFDGCLNIGFGIVIRYKNGTLNNVAYFADEGVSVQDLVNRYNSGQDVYVDAEIVDKVFKQIVKDKKSVIKAAIESKGVSMKSHQIDALVNIAYQYGNCGQYIQGSNNIATLYSNYYEKGDTEGFKNRAIVQTDGGGTAPCFTGSLYANRKKYNWILFNEGRYILADGTELKAGGAGVADFALQFEGENHSRFTSYTTTTGKSFWGDEWCAMFASYCYDQCGLIPSVLKEAYTGCTTEVNTLKGRNEFHDRRTGYIPESGDLIFFTDNGGRDSYHTGIVVECDGSTVYTIEGNSGSGTYWGNTQVTRHQYQINSSIIYGYFSVNGN